MKSHSPSINSPTEDSPAIQLHHYEPFGKAFWLINPIQSLNCRLWWNSDVIFIFICVYACTHAYTPISAHREKVISSMTDSGGKTRSRASLSVLNEWTGFRLPLISGSTILRLVYYCNGLHWWRTRELILLWLTPVRKAYNRCLEKES
jgi:hypothetical protein